MAFIDHNSNGLHDGRETLVAGVNVTLTGTTSQGTPVAVTVGTDPNGGYTFLNVQPGVYAVSAAPKSGLQGMSVSPDAFAIGGGQSVLRDVRFRGIDPLFISLRMFLNTPTSLELLTAQPGVGVAFASDRPNNAPFVRTDAESVALRSISAGKNDPDRLIDLSRIFDDPDLATSPDELLSYAVLSNSNRSLLDATIEGSNLRLRYAANAIGSGVIRVRAADRFGASVATDIQVTVSNQAPVASVVLTPAEPGTNDTLTATVVASDPNGDPVTLTYVWKVNGEVVKTTASTASLTDTLDLSEAGNGDRGDVVTVEVTPNDGTTDGTVATASVTVGNTAPLIAAVALTPDNPGVADTVTATVSGVSDPDGDPVDWTFVWKLDGIEVKTTPGTTSLTDTLDLAIFGSGQRGQRVTVEVTPSDGTDHGAAATASVVVDDLPPVPEVIPDQNFSGPGMFSFDVSGFFSDPDGDAMTFSATLADGSPLPGWLSISAAGVLSGNPSVNDAGVLAIRVIATDVFGLSASAMFQLTSSNTPDSLNDLPNASVTLSPTTPGTNDVLTATVTASDPDGDPLTFTYVWRVNGEVRKTTAGTAATADTFDLSEAGNGDRGDVVTVEVTPNDGTADGAVATATATVGNTAPTVTVSLNSSTPQTDDILTATAGGVGDADGDAVTLTYVWKVDGVVVKTTADTTSLTDTLDLSQAGNGDRGQVITVEVTPFDGMDSGPTATASATVIGNPPVAGVIPDQDFSGPGTFSFDVSGFFSDPDGDAMTFSATLADGSPLPGWLSISAAGVLSGNPSVNDAGVLAIRVTATDPDSLSTSAMFQLTSSNTPDSLNDLPNASVTLSPTTPGTNDVLTATVIASDPDGDPLTFTYVWRVNGEVRKTTAGTTATADTFDLSEAGNGDRGDVVTVEVTPNDGVGLGAEATASVTVANSAPLITSVTLSPNNPDTDALLTATANGVSDPDGDAVTLTYVWRVNGVVVRTTPATLSPTDVLDLALAGFGDTGDEIAVAVTPSDGTLDGAAVSASTTVV